MTAISDTLKKCSTAGALTCTVNGLTNGISYTFVVQATNRVGTGSDWAASPPVVPGALSAAPTQVVAKAGHAEVKISWAASPSPVGAPILYYTVTSVTDTSKWCATTGAMTCTVAPLVNGKAYVFTARAINRIGTGPASVPTAPATPTPPASWTGRTSGTTQTLNAVAPAGTNYVAVGVVGTILTSTNGTNWTTRNSGVTSALSGVAGSGSGWVAVGEGGVILTSPTGSAWTSRASGSANLKAVVRTGTQWVAVGTDGVIFTSP